MSTLKMQPPLLPILAGGGSSGCGSSCGSGGCGSGGVNHNARNVKTPVLEIPFAQRSLNLAAVPSTGSYVQHVDLDLTVECNLRCTY